MVRLSLRRLRHAASDVAICRYRSYFLRHERADVQPPVIKRHSRNRHHYGHQVTLSPRPVQIGRVNWIGLWTLYMREVQRFAKVGMQTVIAPVITSMLFLMVFAVAVGERAQLAGDTDFIAFLVPGLAMMTVLQNAFANTSSSFVVSKVQGNIVDLLMPPIGPGELLVGMAAGGMTRGIAVGLVAAVVLGCSAGFRCRRRR